MRRYSNCLNPQSPMQILNILAGRLATHLQGSGWRQRPSTCLPHISSHFVDVFLWAWMQVGQQMALISRAAAERTLSSGSHRSQDGSNLRHGCQAPAIWPARSRLQPDLFDAPHEMVLSWLFSCELPTVSFAGVHILALFRSVLSRYIV